VIFYCPQHKHVSFFLSNSSDNKWFIFKIPFWSICTSIPFLVCLIFDGIHEAHHAWILSCFSLGVGIWLITWPIFPKFFHDTLNTTRTATPFNCRLPPMCVHTSHWPYGYPILTLCPWQWTHKNPWCSLWHFCCYCTKCWLPHRTKTIICTSFNHTQFLSLTTWHYVRQRWNSHHS
jgi:hypothetical protein